MSNQRPKVTKKVDREKQNDYQRQHEIALLRIYIQKMPDKAREIFQQLNISLAK